MIKESNDVRNKFFGRESIKLFTWICLMTFLAGAVNVYGIKALGTPVTHHTGNSSAIAVSIYEKGVPSLKLVGLLFYYFIGSMLSGVVFHNRYLIARKRYGIILMFGGMMLAAIDLLDILQFRLQLIGFWIGMQNGMFIKYKGALVRTSHITGYLTDAGFSLGAYLRGVHTEGWKVIFYLLSILSFIVGGVFGYLILDKCLNALMILGLLYCMCGLFYFIMRKRELLENR